MNRIFVIAFCALSIGHLAFATHDSPDSIPIYQDAAAKAQAASTLEPAKSTTTQVDERLLKAVDALGARIGDLFVCVPGKMDSLYSTQSWYLLNTFLGFNNNLARSTLSSDASFGDDLKARIIAKALAQIKARNPGLEDSDSIQKYLGSVADVSEYVFKTALESRNTYAKSTDLDSLLIKGHKTGDKNIFEKLKIAHNEHKNFLERKECVGLSSNFWGTPRFAFTQTQESEAAAKQAPSTTKTTRQATQTVSSQKPPQGSHTASTNTGPTSNVPVISTNAAEIDAKYGRSKRISAKLPYSAWEDRKVNGYHTYYGKNGYLWGRPYVIGNIMKAANVLKDKGIYMGVGDINREPYAWPANYHRETPGHGSHDQGRAVDLRLIGPDGEARPCTVEQPSCYDRGKTFEMIKALIDADPKELRVIYINDPKLRKMIEDYLVSAHGYSRGAADEAVQYWPCHDNHVHFHWRNDYAKR